MWLVERRLEPTLSYSPTSPLTFLARETCSKDIIALESSFLDRFSSQLPSDEIVVWSEKSPDVTKLVSLFVRERLSQDSIYQSII